MPSLEKTGLPEVGLVKSQVQSFVARVIMFEIAEISQRGLTAITAAWSRASSPD